ncbi:MAG: Ku protein [Gemmatimonadota bacterium]
MQTLWHGTLRFGLVEMPIRLRKAVRRRRVEFNLLHEPDMAPIRYWKVCAEEERRVPDEEIVRGYRLDGEWVTVSDEELDRLAPTLRRTIDIHDFVDLHEIDPVYFRRPYYVAPDEDGEEIYVMLREAIRRSGKVGIAEFVLMHREHLAVVRTRGEALVVETLHYPEELIDEEALELPAETRLREGEIRMAVELIENLATRFEPSRYRNEYRDDVLDLIRRKARGELPPELRRPPPEPRPTSVIELDRRLRESVERARRERRAA